MLTLTLGESAIGQNQVTSDISFILLIKIFLGQILVNLLTQYQLNPTRFIIHKYNLIF